MISNCWTYTGIKLSIDQRIKLEKEIIVESKSQGALNCGSPNFAESSGVKPLVSKVLRTSFGSNPLSLAVWMMVEMRDTFFLQRTSAIDS